MRSRRVTRLVSNAAEASIQFAAKAANSRLAANAAKSVLHNKILCLGASAALAVAVAMPIFSRTDIAPAAATSTLKCYGSVGESQPCATQAAAVPRVKVRTVPAPHLASWTTTALYQEAGWKAAVEEQPATWTTVATAAPVATASPAAPPAPDATIASDATTAPEVAAVPDAPPAAAARHSGASGRHSVSAACRRHLIPCFFSTLRKGVTHLASVAAKYGASPNRHGTSVADARL